MVKSTCPRCQARLVFDSTLSLGPDDHSDEYTFKLFHCTHCPLVGAGNYEESRRGSDARWHHDGVEIGRTDYDRIARDIAKCPTPRTAQRDCEVHRRYRSDTTHDPLAGVAKIGDWFDLG